MPYVKNEEGDIVFHEWCDGLDVVIGPTCLKCNNLLHEDYGALEFNKCVRCMETLNANSSNKPPPVDRDVPSPPGGNWMAPDIPEPWD